MPIESTADATIPLKLALVPIPSANVAVPLPASVVTLSDVILRMQLLPLSATYTFPTESTATVLGLLNVALVPAPSANVVPPFPATVVTTPSGVILRIR